jgi:hypothetical protein
MFIRKEIKAEPDGEINNHITEQQFPIQLLGFWNFPLF